MASKIPLDMIEIASPCTASWDAMRGDDRTRLCGQCDKYVYNLSEMTRAEAEALVAECEGTACVRFFKRADGTMLTANCPVGLHAIRRAAVKWLWLEVGSVCVLLGIVLLPVLSAMHGDHNNLRGHIPAPVARVMDWLFPPTRCVMGDMAPPPAIPGAGVPNPQAQEEAPAP